MSTGTVDFRAKCPFGSNACLTPAVRFDSGPLNSNDDLGINSPMKHSLSLRRVTTCAPIDAEKYATQWRDNLTERYTGKTTTSVKFYEFGKGDTECLVTLANETTNATTFCVSQRMRDYQSGAYLLT
jgi:hypothetical protein